MVHPNSPLESLLAFALAFMAGALFAIGMTVYAEKIRRDMPRPSHCK